MCRARLRYKQTYTTTTSTELTYKRSKYDLDTLSQNEAYRRLELRNLLLRDGLDELNQSLMEEGERADHAEQDADSWKNTAADAQSGFERVENELRSRIRELENVRVELSSLSHLNDSSSALLTEKLSLQRELGALKPELEHFRSQATSNDHLLSEKLLLQRQLTSTKAELEDAHRESARLQKKLGKENEAEVALQQDIEDLRKVWAQEKEERSRAEKAATKASQEATKANQEGSAATVAELQELKQTLAIEKRERSQAENSAEKAAKKEASDWEASKAVLEDKLDQFRNKLRSTKQTLKETQEELMTARNAAAAATSKAVLTTKNPRKRAAEADATVGTPGDAGPGPKRNKRASSVIGEKSTFSITPLLNRTRNVSAAPDQPQEKQREASKQPTTKPVEEPVAPEMDAAIAQDPDVPLPSIEPASALNSPFTSRETSIAPDAANDKPRPLGPASPGKANLKVKPSAPAARRKAAVTSKLEMVTEEIDEDENNEPAQQQLKVATKAAPAKPRLSLKPRSLSTFSSFRDGSVQPREQSMQSMQKKKRKLLGNAAETIFDEDEEANAPANPRSRLGSLGFGGQRAFGAFGAGGLGRMGGLIGGKKKGPLVVAEDGFMFSPLKKQRKAMAEAARGVEA